MKCTYCPKCGSKRNFEQEYSLDCIYYCKKCETTFDIIGT